MNYLSILICIIVIIIESKQHNKFSPAFLMAIFWMYLLIGDWIHLYNLYPITNMKTYLIIFVGLLTFFIGCYLNNIIYVHNNNLSTWEIDNRKTSVLILLSIIFCLPNMIQAIKYLQSGLDMNDIKMLFYTSSFNSTYIQSFFLNYVSKPMISAGILVWSISLFEKENNSFFMTFLVLISIFSFYLATGVRDLFISVCIYLFFLMLLRVDINKIRAYTIKKNKKIFIYFVIIGLICIVSIVFAGNNIFTTLYYYTSASITALDVMMNYISNYHMQYTYGFVSFNGLIRPIFELLQRFNISMPYIYILADTYINMQQNTITISQGQSFNAFFTVFLNMYLDGGYCGVVLISFISGWGASHIYKKCFLNMNHKYLSYYLFVVGLIFTSMVRYQFASYTYALTLFYLQFMFKKISRKN